MYCEPRRARPQLAKVWRRRTIARFAILGARWSRVRFSILALIVGSGCAHTSNRSLPRAEAQRPSFAGQTRAPKESTRVPFRLDTIVRDLQHPWSLALLPSGSILVTERIGRLRMVDEATNLSAVIGGLPVVEARRGGEGGLLDVVLDPAFATNSRIYWSFVEQIADTLNGLAVATGVLASDDSIRMEHVTILYRQVPPLNTGFHFGGRLVFDRDGKLFVTHGDGMNPDGLRLVQRLDALVGKIVRINADGSEVAPVF